MKLSRGWGDVVCCGVLEWCCVCVDGQWCTYGVVGLGSVYCGMLRSFCGVLEWCVCVDGGAHMVWSV